VLLGLGSKPVGIVPTALIRKEMDIRASRMNSRRFPEAIALAAGAGLSLTELITHRMLLGSAADAFDLLTRRPDEACKIVLHPL
jgi:threonine dehydrogenase-like Zn-dependent dehydrogenase